MLERAIFPLYKNYLDYVLKILIYDKYIECFASLLQLYIVFIQLYIQMVRNNKIFFASPLKLSVIEFMFHVGDSVLFPVDMYIFV